MEISHRKNYYVHNTITFSMLVREMYVNSNYIDITMIITVKIYPSIQFLQP